MSTRYFSERRENTKEKKELGNKAIELAESDKLTRQDETEEQLGKRKKITKLLSTDYTKFVNRLETYLKLQNEF